MTEDDARAASLRAKLLKLQHAYAEGIPDRLTKIGRVWRAYRATGAEEARTETLTRVHKMAGTATMYGLGDLGKLAFTAEETLLALEEDSSDRTVADAESAIGRLLEWSSGEENARGE